MSLAGIAPNRNYPPGCSGLPEDCLKNEKPCLDFLLAPLRDLPEVRIAHDDGDDWAHLPNPVAATIELELDPEAPHLDFVSQTLRLLRRLTETRGVVLTQELVAMLDRVGGHTRGVMEAYEQRGNP
jgi:hypothetical protein